MFSPSLFAAASAVIFTVGQLTLSFLSQFGTHRFLALVDAPQTYETNRSKFRLCFEAPTGVGVSE